MKNYYFVSKKESRLMFIKHDSSIVAKCSTLVSTIQIAGYIQISGCGYTANIPWQSSLEGEGIAGVIF